MTYHYIVNTTTGKAFVKTKNLQEAREYVKGLTKLGHPITIKTVHHNQEF